jgi:transcriptional regulator with XRE-family HTH domain
VGKNNNVNRLVGDLIRLHRVTRNWSHVDLAKHCGLSVTVIDQIEGADPAATLADIEIVANAFGIPLANLVQGGAGCRECGEPIEITQRSALCSSCQARARIALRRFVLGLEEAACRQEANPA